MPHKPKEYDIRRRDASASVLSKLIEPRSQEMEQKAKVDLPNVEGVVEAQLGTCQSLAEAASAAAEVLAGAGTALQRRNGGQKYGDATKEAALVKEDSTVSSACRSFLTACGGLGEALVTLAAVMTGEVLEPLQDMQRTLEERREKEKAELAHLEQYELLCTNALVESKARHDRASMKLRQRLKEREGRRSPAKNMLRLDAEPDAKLQHAAHAQTAAVEELATRIDQVTLARASKDRAVDTLYRLLSQVDVIRRKLLRESFGRCARAWENVAGTLQNFASQLHGTAEELEVASEVVSKAVQPFAPAVCSGACNGAAAFPSVASAEARRQVPRLQLADLLHQESVRRVQATCVDSGSESSLTSEDDSGDEWEGPSARVEIAEELSGSVVGAPGASKQGGKGTADIETWLNAPLPRPTSVGASGKDPPKAQQAGKAAV